MARPVQISCAVALALFLVAAVQCQAIENSVDDPIQYEGFSVCAHLSAKDTARPCETCCQGFGFKVHMFWGMNGDGKCTCTSYNPQLAAAHASEAAQNKNYSACASLNGKNDVAAECTLCCREKGFKLGAFASEWTDGQCCCMLAANKAN